MKSQYKSPSQKYNQAFNSGEGNRLFVVASGDFYLKYAILAGKRVLCRLNLYRTWAQGGASVLVTGNVMINPQGKGSAGDVVVYGTNGTVRAGQIAQPEIIRVESVAENLVGERQGRVENGAELRK